MTPEPSTWHRDVDVPAVKIAGEWASLLLAVAPVGSGMLAGACATGSAAYAVRVVFGWRVGLEKPRHRAKYFYGVMAVSSLIGVEINFLGINSARADVDVPGRIPELGVRRVAPLVIQPQITRSNRYGELASLS